VIIIPNRKFISEEVVNWTHNDLIMRATIEVGVAYGTDVSRVREVLFDIVKGHEKVKEDPEPRVWFTAFGDSTLNVRVHVFTDLEFRLQVVTELNIAITRRFEEEGIEIAFPQRDLHLKSVQDETVRRALADDPGRPLTSAPEDPGVEP
jgi:small-conductance mechanosensitive channel